MIMFVIYFVVGFIEDALSTLDFRAFIKDQVYTSVAISTVRVIISYTIFYNIILSNNFMEGIVIYALGGGAGVIFVMRGLPHVSKKYEAYRERQKRVQALISVLEKILVSQERGLEVRMEQCRYRGRLRSLVNYRTIANSRL